MELLPAAWYLYMIVTSISFYWFDHIAFAILNTFVLAFGIVLDLLPRSFRLHVFSYGRSGLISAISVAAFMMAFAFGYDLGHSYLINRAFNPHMIVFRDSKSTSGRIVRAGAQGILFVDSGNTLHFFRMDDVLSISRK
jgi:hypothetical protein